ncbi:hypothetical protein ABPG74_001968 [Tetrahymena malaccensis]
MKSKFYIKSLPYSFVGFEENKLENNQRMNNYLLGINDMESILSLQNDVQFPFYYFQSHTIANEYLTQKFQQKDNKAFFNDARQMLNSEGNYQDSDVEITPIYVQTTYEDVLAYLVKFPKQETKMNKEKLKSFNIPGKMMKEFQQNKQIELNGKIIKLQDVLEDPQPAQLLLIFDCVSEECVQNIINSKDIPYQSTLDSCIYAVIHMTPIHILKSNLYQQFLKQFDQNTLHIFVNSHLKDSKVSEKSQKVSKEVFLHVEATNIIAEKFAENFPSISESSSAYKSKVEFLELELNELFPFLKNKTISKKNYQLIFNAKQNEEVYQPIQQQVSTKKYLLTEDFEIQAQEVKKELIKEVQSAHFQSLESFLKEKTKDYDPSVYFLGTTCMMPTTFRNNSSILVYEKTLKQGIMLDCGEGTYYQLLNQFGEAECQEVLRNLKVIILTHAHSDHYLGFQGIVYQRQKAFEIAKKLQNMQFTEEEQTLYLALPWCLAPWYAAIDGFMEKMNCKLIYFQEFNGENIQNLFEEYKKDEFNDKELEQQKQEQKDQQNGGDASEDDELLKNEKQQSKEIENCCQKNEREEAKQQDDEKTKCDDGDEEEEEDNRGHKAKVRAQQLINYLNSTQQDIDKSIIQFKQYLLSSLGIEEIIFVPVIHCSQAYGVVFRHKSGVKISYSGDTRPCPEFAKVAEGSDLMIHEGTFNHDLLEHAKKARHSTATEAIQIAMQAKVKALVLTHLSKRHSKLDLGDFQDQSQEKNRFIKYQTALALDHLQFKLSEFYSLPFISKGVHSLFPDQDEK